MGKITGKWVQGEDQPYPGLAFKFKNDGTFEAQYEPMGIVSSGTYVTKENNITVEQTSHSLGLVGVFKGLFSINDDKLQMALASAPGGPRPDDLKDARVYQKE